MKDTNFEEKIVKGKAQLTIFTLAENIFLDLSLKDKRNKITEDSYHIKLTCPVCFLRIDIAALSGRETKISCVTIDKRCVYLSTFTVSLDIFLHVCDVHKRLFKIERRIAVHRVVNVSVALKT